MCVVAETKDGLQAVNLLPKLNNVFLGYFDPEKANFHVVEPVVLEFRKH